MQNFFRVSQRPEDTYVAGLSMGGYGAMKLALTHPERYAAAASLSGALDLDELSSRPERVELFERIFGETIPATPTSSRCSTRPTRRPPPAARQHRHRGRARVW